MREIQIESANGTRSRDGKSDIPNGFQTDNIASSPKDDGENWTGPDSMGDPYRKITGTKAEADTPRLKDGYTLYQSLGIVSAVSHGFTLGSRPDKMPYAQKYPKAIIEEYKALTELKHARKLSRREAIRLSQLTASIATIDRNDPVSNAAIARAKERHRELVDLKRDILALTAKYIDG